MRPTLSLFALLLLPACSQSATPISIDITAGQETTAFTDAAVSTCSIRVFSLDKSYDTTVSAAPDQTFDFPSNLSGDEQVSVTVACTSADGTQVMAGQSLSGLLLSSVSGDIPVFVQRTEQWARPPGGLACAHVGGVGTVGAERYLMLTGGTRATGDTTCDPTAVDTYDMFGLSGDAPAPAYSPVPQTVVSLGSQLLIIGPPTGTNSGAALVDFAGSEPIFLTAPAPLTSFADVAGGAVILGTTNSYVVGATRPGSASKMVLQVANDGTLTGYALSVARQGAAAAWVENNTGAGFVGLVVAGGNGDAGVAGVEVLPANGTSFATIPYPPDAVTGAGAVADGLDGIFLFGGVTGTTRHLSVTCNASCTAMSLDTPTLPSLTGVSAYRLPSGTDLVLGTNPAQMGMMRSFIVDATNLGAVMVKEALLKEPRKGATPTSAPNGTLALLGGQHADGSPALSIEMFQP